MVVLESVIERPHKPRNSNFHDGFPEIGIACQHCCFFSITLSQLVQFDTNFVDIGGRVTHPTLPSSEIEISFCASTANSIGNCCSTSLTKPLTTSAVASSADMPRCWQ